MATSRCNRTVAEGLLLLGLKKNKMVLLKQYLIITLICLALVLSNCTNQLTNTLYSAEINNTENCLTINNFDLVKNFILKNGIQTKLYKTGIIADTNTLSRQIYFKNKTLALIDYQNHNHIIIIDKLDAGLIPTYFVSNENNSCQTSAYYSVFETDSSVSVRNGNWCEIINGIKNNKIKNILIDKKTALIIAQNDAQAAYKEVSAYTITAELINTNWHVDYNLSDLQMIGGGPHYIICGKSGNIINRRYEQ